MAVWLLLLCGMDAADIGSAQQDAQVVAAEILASPGVRHGLVVQLGCGDGRLAAELSASGANVVFGLTSDPVQAATARGNIQSRGIYGIVSIDVHSDSSIPLEDNTANLVVVGDFQLLAKNGLKIDEVLRVLAPYGTAFLKGITTLGSDLKVTHDGEWTKIVKPYPNAMDEWTQYYHDSSGMMRSSDRIAGPVGGIRWINGGYWNGSMADPVEMVSAGGRIFYANMTASAGRPEKGFPSAMGFIEARDAFNGHSLWRRKILPAEYRAPHSRIIALDDKVYAPVVEEKERLGEFDAASGRLLRTFDISSPGIECANGLFLVDHGQKAWSVATGKKVWDIQIPDPPKPARRGEDQGLRYFVTDGNRIFYRSAGLLLGFMLETGKKQWETPVRSEGELLLFSAFGRVITEERGPDTEKADTRPPLFTLRAYDESSGAFLWKYEFSDAVFKSRVQAFQTTRDEIWCHALREFAGEARAAPVFICLDAATGREKRTVRTTINSARCHPHRSTELYLLGADAELFDISTEQTGAASSALRGGCQFGFLPANGLLYQELNKCLCFNSLRGVAGFAAVSPALKSKEGARLEKGPHFGDTGKPSASGGEAWPTLRHDVRRSASAETNLPAALLPGWTTKLPGKPSSPVVAGGAVFVALKDRHAVYALSATDGRVLWNFTAGGRIDSPPTYQDGKIVFGSMDGWCYCLNAVDGKLNWRFRCSPADLRIMVRGQLESVWPVHGALLVEKGIVYVSAGRHTDLDGGIYLYALDVKTGEVIWENRVSHDPVAFNDILVIDGTELFLDQLDLDKATGRPLKKTQEAHAGTKGLWGGPLGMLNDEVLEPPYSGQSGGRKHWRYLGYDGHLLAIDGDRVFGAVYEATAYGAEHIWRYGYRGWGKGEEGKFTLTGNKIFGATADGTWSHEFPVDPEFRLKALIRTGDKVFAAVAPNRNDTGKGGIWIYAAADGKELGRINIEAAPGFDGMAAGADALIISTENDSVISLRTADR